MTLNLKMLATLDAAGVKTGARDAQSHLRLVGNEAQKTGKKLSDTLDAQFGIGISSVSDRASDIEAYGASLDALRAKINPMFALQHSFEAGVTEIAEAHRLGAISAREAADATARVTALFQAQRTALSQLNSEAQKTAPLLAETLNAQFGIEVSSTADRASDIEAYGASLDDLRAKFNPMFGLQRRYETGLEEISNAHKVGAISAKEAATATAHATGIYNAQKAALTSSSKMLGSFANSNRLAASEVNILAQQLSDGAIQVASGQSLFTAILQQGSQVQFLLGSKGVNTIGGSIALLKQGLIGFLNPINLAIAGLAAGAAGAAALYNVIAADDSATDALETQNNLIEALADRYDEVAAALDRLQDRPSAAILALDTDALETQRETLRSLIADIEQDVQRSLRIEANALSALAEPLTEDAALFRAFQQELRATADTFSLTESEADQLIGRLLELAQTAPDTTSELAIRALITEARSADTGLLALVERLGEVEAALYGVGYAADSLGRVEEAANSRIGQAFGIFEEGTARDRLRSQLPKPKTETGRPRRNTDRFSDYLATQDQTLERLRLEISLVGQSEVARRKALAALEAEIQIRELGTAVSEKRAESLRDNARAIAEETLALEELRSAWGAVQRTGETAIRSLVTQLADGNLTGALRSAITEVSQLGLQLAAINPLTNALFGTARPTLGAASGFLGGLFGSFDGGGPTGAGRDSEVAGLVHRNEYVFDAQSTRKIGVNTLETLRQGALRGYQSGGLVTTSAFPAPKSAQARPASITPDTVRETGDTFLVNITTPDIQSFRASRSQLAGEFARMTVRGGRNG